MELLDLSACTTNEEVSTAIKNRVKSVKFEDLILKLSETSVFHEEATKKIYAALATGNNALLYGPGGFGKSVLVKRICEVLGLPIIYKVGYKGMMPDELFGVPNMKILMEESRYETAFENSLFSKPGILILEEFLDADPSTAAALKDILTDKGLREGSTRKESLISSVIITGNKTPEDLSEDDSTGAFYLERFPFRHNTQWERFKEEDYMKFFKVYYTSEVYDDQYQVLTFVARLCAGTNELVSPRVASQAASVAIELGVDYLDTLVGLDTTLISDIKYQLENDTEQVKENEFLNRVQAEVICCIDSVRVFNLDKAMSAKAALTTINEKLHEYEISDSNYHRLKEIYTLIDHGLEQIEKSLLDNVDLQSITSNINNLFSDGKKS